MQKVVRSARHTGLVVSNLNRSLDFYSGVLGLEVVGRKKEKGPYIDSVVGIKGVELEWIKLRTQDGYIIELLNYISHPDTSSASAPARSNRLGCSHVAFTVNDIDPLYEKLTAEGFACNSKPQVSPDGKVKVMYAHDPDGIILELVQEIK
ncbi:MAG: hypothetical protein A2270_04550 [Elusimicrobia bacterium RIFOXYA12_FULL_51_18]|nr:MAG: hypothetical protein A2270_04550 [Elusimicrobia bacterium RIFOXYA12_FULL_51_18]OGS32847.1 MAG: hypothetical protein A2218_10605 [Elusimicrobia bacterium RIFOXYA2_FULL_53_38]